MISFDLRCANDHVFEAWFANTKAYQEQVDAGELVCPLCGNAELEKSLMAPNVATGSKQPTQVSSAPMPAATGASDKGAELMRLARAVRAEVEKNFEHVGSDFAEEAKKIYYGESENRDIHGEMTRDEAVELHEEGVEFGVLPWPSKEDA